MATRNLHGSTEPLLRAQRFVAQDGASSAQVQYAPREEPQYQSAQPPWQPAAAVSEPRGDSFDFTPCALWMINFLATEGVSTERIETEDAASQRLGQWSIWKYGATNLELSHEAMLAYRGYKVAIEVFEWKLSGMTTTPEPSSSLEARCRRAILHAIQELYQEHCAVYSTSYYSGMFKRNAGEDWSGWKVFFHLNKTLSEIQQVPCARALFTPWLDPFQEEEHEEQEQEQEQEQEGTHHDMLRCTCDDVQLLAGCRHSVDLRVQTIPLPQLAEMSGFPPQHKLMVAMRSRVQFQTNGRTWELADVHVGKCQWCRAAIGITEGSLFLLHRAKARCNAERGCNGTVSAETIWDKVRKRMQEHESTRLNVIMEEEERRGGGGGGGARKKRPRTGGAARCDSSGSDETRASSVASSLSPPSVEIRRGQYHPKGSFSAYTPGPVVGTVAAGAARKRTLDVTWVLCVAIVLFGTQALLSVVEYGLSSSSSSSSASSSPSAGQNTTTTPVSSPDGDDQEESRSRLSIESGWWWLNVFGSVLSVVILEYFGVEFGRWGPRTAKEQPMTEQEEADVSISTDASVGFVTP